MKEGGSFLDLYKQNDRLSIRITTPAFGQLSAEILDGYGLTHRKPNYFLLFMVDGSTQHGVDLQQFSVNNNELLFIVPHQIHQLPLSKQGADYFKLSFDEQCLSLLPKQFAFLINPLNNQNVCLSLPAASRIKSTFNILLELLSKMNTDPALILVYLNCLLTEIDASYFSASQMPADNKLSKYIEFRKFVENNFTDHPKVSDIARELALSVSSLYNIVKHYSGVSPKEFIIYRLMLEARRHLYYSEHISIKELAFELGFNDPEYFSRLFKKVTGKAIGAFLSDFSGH